MNSISIDDEKYVKATDIARELGYTSDYVGQLCRAGKVNAQLVGRSWYVSEESINSHKKTRYRSSKIVSKKTIETSLETKDSDSQKSFTVPVSIKKNIDTHYATQKFYSRAEEKPAHNYFPDDSELIPSSLKVKTGRLSVSLGDAHSVKIKSNSKEFDFTPTARLEVKFKGSLAVTDVYDAAENDAVVEEELKTEPEPSDVQDSVHESVLRQGESSDTEIDEITSKIKVKHLRKDTKITNRTLPIEHNANGVLGMRRDRIVDRNPIGGTLKVGVPSDNVSVSTTGIYFIVISTVVSVLFSFFMLGLQADMYVEGSTVITSYTFELSSLLAAVYSAW